MIPYEFFDWVIAQWWGAPAFVVLVLTGLILFAAGMAGGVSR